MGGFEIVLAVVLFVLVAFVIMNAAGIKMIGSSESVSITNNPKNEKDWNTFVKEKEQKRKADRENTKKAEQVLEEFIQFKKDKRTPMEDSEQAFLKELSTKIDAENKIKDAQKIMGLMTNSYQFYRDVKSIGNNEIIDDMLSIQPSILENFSEKNPATNDWIDFIKEQTSIAN